jgi:hypothetical protein
MIVDGTDANAPSIYTFTVSGDVEPSTELSSAPSEGNKWDEMQDNIDGKTVSGTVGKGFDGYRYSGTLTNLQVDGEVKITNESTA